MRAVTFRHPIGKTVLHMILDQLALRVGDGAFDGVELLREIHAGPTLLDHCNDSGEMTVGAVKTLDDLGVRGMFHTGSISPRGGYLLAPCVAPGYYPVMSGRREHWDEVYEAKGDLQTSWFQELPSPSLQLASRHAPSAKSAIDIGGGTSRLVDNLLGEGFSHVAVLDLSQAALSRARERVGDDERVTWIVADAATFKPARTYDLWHDRAALHFLVDEEDRRNYADALVKGTQPGSIAIIGTFALKGPEKCSGLPVRRYGPSELTDLVGPGFALEESLEEEHRTPWQSTQLFHFGVLRRL